jgi:hypothetical protein
MGPSVELLDEPPITVMVIVELSSTPFGPVSWTQ